MQPEPGPSIRDEKSEGCEEVKQNDINMEIEKEEVNSIQKQANEIEKLQSEKTESRFSFMKFLRKENKKEEESSSNTDPTGNLEIDDNGLPSYSEATMDPLGPKETNVDPVTFADGATQTMDEQVVNDEDTKALLGQDEKSEENENTNEIEEEKPKRFKFLNFLQK